jgi:hypothetical protein
VEVERVCLLYCMLRERGVEACCVLDAWGTRYDNAGLYRVWSDQSGDITAVSVGKRGGEDIG